MTCFEGPPTPATLPTTVVDLLLARADDDGPGLHFEGMTWTWREVVAECRRRAALLREQRQPGPFHVAVLLDNVPEHLFLLGGAALAGAVVAGVNRTRRGDALWSDVELADAQLLFTEKRYLALLGHEPHPLAADRIQVVDEPAFDRRLQAVAVAEDEHLVPLTEPSDLWLLLFTSGTSGAAKAVRVTHRRVVAAGLRGLAEWDYRRDDVVYLSMPLFHGACVMAGLAPTIAVGGQIVLKRRYSASGFLDDVRGTGATRFHYVGKAMSYILATPPRGDDHLNPLRRADGNEGGDFDIVRFAERFGCQVVDGFGSTEGGVGVVRTPDTPPGSIGRPLPGVDIVDGDQSPVRDAVFDEHRRLVNADEAVGEMINRSGAGGFEGYYGDDTATTERMRGGVYHSGDLAYRDDAGFYYFAGRAGEWLRVDGENLGVAPIERVLARHDDVVRVAVLGVPAPDVGDDVMAVLELRPEATFEAEEFRRFLDAQGDLGAKAIPRYLRIVDELPETETHKVVKRVLAETAWAGDDPVWWRDGSASAFTPMGAVARRRLRDRFEDNGRSHLLPDDDRDRGGAS